MNMIIKILNKVKYHYIALFFLTILIITKQIIKDYFESFLSSINIFFDISNHFDLKIVLDLITGVTNIIIVFTSVSIFSFMIIFSIQNIFNYIFRDSINQRAFQFVADIFLGYFGIYSLNLYIIINQVLYLISSEGFMKSYEINQTMPLFVIFSIFSYLYAVILIGVFKNGVIDN